MKFFSNLWNRHRTVPPHLAGRDFSQYFKSSEVSGLQLEKKFMGKLVLPGGFIIASDPLLGLQDAVPFSRKIAPGEYPVTMLMAGGEGRKKNALLCLSFSDAHPKHWELAVLPGQSSSIARSGYGFYGFTADAGIGCICDAQTQQHYNQYLKRLDKSNGPYNAYDQLFEKAFGSKPDGDDRLCYNFYLPSHPQLNVIVFHTGYGDGIYPAYWGITENREVCSLVIDFIVV